MLRALLQKALTDVEAGFGHLPMQIDDEAVSMMAAIADGDARQVIKFSPRGSLFSIDRERERKRERKKERESEHRARRKGTLVLFFFFVFFCPPFRVFVSLLYCVSRR